MMSRTVTLPRTVARLGYVYLWSSVPFCNVSDSSIRLLNHTAESIHASLYWMGEILLLGCSNYTMKQCILTRLVLVHVQ